MKLTFLQISNSKYICALALCFCIRLCFGQPVLQDGTTSLTLRGTVPNRGKLAVWLEDLRMRHPGLQAARARQLSALRLLDSVDAGFHDPVLQTSAGYADGPSEAPHITIPRLLPSDAFSVQGGVEVPLGAGIYGGAGVALRRLDATDDAGSENQASGGGRLRMPLLRDRDYRGVKLETRLREAEYRQMKAITLETCQTLTTELVLSYTAWLQQAADSRAVSKSLERAEKLLAETSTRAELEVAPEYQVFPARFEAALRREELESSLEQLRQLWQTVEEKLGLAEKVDPDQDVLSLQAPDMIILWAEALAERDPVPAPNLEEICARRGEYRAMEAHIAALEAQVQIALEQMRDELSLQVGLHWDNADSRSAGDSSTEDFGYEIGVVYRRTVGRRGEQAQVESAKAELEALQADRELLRIRIHAEEARAVNAWKGACARLDLARSAVEEATRVMAAEDERFALGEGSSRNVLDAQKDLTSASRRHVAVAGQVVSAYANLQRARGIEQDGGNE